MTKFKITIITILLFTLSVKAQDIELANHFFNITAYVKAAKIYENESNKTQEVYEKLADCYYYNSEMEQAVKWYNLLMLKHEDTTSPSYFFKYAQALKGIKEYKEANYWLKKYKNNLQKNKDYTDANLAIFKEDEHQKSIYEISSLDFNTSDIDFGGAYFNNKLIFSSSRTGGKDFDWNNKPYLDLYQADIDTFGNLINIQQFSSKINTKLHESNAVFTKDGKRMYFTRNNYLDGKKITDSKNVTHLKIYSADFIENKWGNIQELPFNGDNYSVMHPALSDDDKKLYFSSDRPGTIGSFDLFVVDIIGKNSYSKPKNLGSKINTEQLEQFPFYSKDTLYFSSNGLLGFGGLDVFKTSNSELGFTNPENLHFGINSNLDDFGYVLDEKTSTGYISSNRTEGAGADDIYSFKKAYQNLLMKGLVKDKTKLNLIDDATVALLNDKDSILETLKTDKDGSFSFKLDPNKEYTIKAHHKLYAPETYQFKTPDSNSTINKTILLDLYQTIDKNIVLKNNKVQIDHEPIYFDFNSSYIRADAIPILDNIVSIIKSHPSMKIHCASHTDSRGEDKYNAWLSERRAFRTAEYLISKGIDSNRISKDGYGESELVNKCSNNVNCTEEEHQLNRRTEFILE